MFVVSCLCVSYMFRLVSQVFRLKKVSFISIVVMLVINFEYGLCIMITCVCKKTESYFRVTCLHNFCQLLNM